MQPRCSIVRLQLRLPVVHESESGSKSKTTSYKVLPTILAVDRDCKKITTELCYAGSANLSSGPVSNSELSVSQIEAGKGKDRGLTLNRGLNRILAVGLGAVLLVWAHWFSASQTMMNMTSPHFLLLVSYFSCP